MLAGMGEIAEMILTVGLVMGIRHGKKLEKNLELLELLMGF